MFIGSDSISVLGLDQNGSRDGEVGNTVRLPGDFDIGRSECEDSFSGRSAFVHAHIIDSQLISTVF